MPKRRKLLLFDGRLVIILLVGSATALWTVVVGSWSFAQGGGEPNRQIEFQNGIVSANLRDVAMSDVLLAIGKQAGVKISIYGKLGRVKAQTFKHIPMEDGVTRLLEGSNVDFIMIYGPGRRLTEVRAYKWPKGPRPVPPPLRIPIPGVQSVPAQYK